MSLKFENKKACLEEGGYILLSTEKEFKETESFRFRCTEGHETVQKYTSLNNRMSLWKRGGCPSLCGICCTRIPIVEKLVARLTELGFELIKLDEDNINVEYRCKCGSVSKTTKNNLHKATRQSQCNKCQNSNRKELHLQEKKHQIAQIELPRMDLPHGYKCLTEGCQDYAIFDGEKRPSFCEEHAVSPKLFTLYTRRQCIATGCTTRATFNYRTGQRVLFCQEHRRPEMINVNYLKCDTCGVENARYNTKENYPRPMFCKDHRSEDMVDCIEKLCNPPECWKQGTFAFSKFDKKVVCKEHRLEGMKDVKNLTRVCGFAGCEKQANFNVPAENRPIRCAEHKEMGMVDIYHDRCQVEECTTRPVYNYDDGQSKGIYCVYHKREGMVDVVSRRCQYRSCTIQPVYNYPELTSGAFCDVHKLEGMIDVKNKNCKAGSCSAQAQYGIVGESASRCRSHIEKGMIKYPNRKCNHLHCKETAQYGHEGCYPLYCELHYNRTEHINLMEQVCSGCGLMNILRNGMCMFCNPITTREFLRKQNDVKEWLHHQGYSIISSDKRIEGGVCGKERPDFIIETSYGFFIVIEVDEFQHFSYLPECEIARMINISQSLGSPTMFIRYNPDKYNIGFTKHDTGPSYRYKVLKRWIDTCMQLSVDNIKDHGFCSQVKLFYNDFNEHQNSLETILPFD